MTVENCEKLHLGMTVIRSLWVLEIQDDRNPVLIVRAYDAIVSVCTVSNHVSTFLVLGACLLDFGVLLDLH